MGNRQRLNRTDDLLSHQNSPLLIGLWQHYNKLLTTITPDNITITKSTLLYRLGNTLQTFIAAYMTITIVILLKKIHIQHHKRTGFSMPA